MTKYEVTEEAEEGAAEEAKLLEQSDNSARPEDGVQPAQDENPGLEEVTD